MGVIDVGEETDGVGGVLTRFEEGYEFGAEEGAVGVGDYLLGHGIFKGLTVGGVLGAEGFGKGFFGGRGGGDRDLGEARN